MIPQKIFEQIDQHFDSVISHDSELGKELWYALTELHPADIASYLQNLSRENFQRLFVTFPEHIQIEVFHYLSDTLRAYTLSVIDDAQRTVILDNLSMDEFTDLVDFVSEDELKHYFKLMKKNDREKVVSLMKFSPESAGGVMDIDVLSLPLDLTVGKAVQLLQKLQPDREVHDVIYVIDKEKQLVGHINLEDLVIKSPQTPLTHILKKNEMVARVEEDQEAVAQKMLHYHLTTVPVVGANSRFLGVIPSETLAEIIEEEGAEDLYKISAMAPIKKTYFETSFMKLFLERGYILAILLLVESFASFILQAHEKTFENTAMFVFFSMLISTGGNTSSQTSALAIQGLASGEINPNNIWRFLYREFRMSFMLAIALGATAFARVYISSASTMFDCVVLSISVMFTVLLSVTLGSFVPLMLKRLGGDPAMSAGPFLATAMDIISVFLLCYIAHLAKLSGLFA